MIRFDMADRRPASKRVAPSARRPSTTAAKVVRSTRQRSRTAVLTEFAGLVSRRGTLPRPAEIEKRCPGLLADAEVYFDSFEAIASAVQQLRAAPAPVSVAASSPPVRQAGRARIPTMSRAEVFTTIRAMFRESRLHLGSASALHRDATKVCGSWPAAVEAATLATGADAITRADVLPVISTLAERRPMLTAAQFGRSLYAPAVLHHFRTIERAAAAAGLVGWPRVVVPPRATR